MLGNVELREPPAEVGPPRVAHPPRMLACGHSLCYDCLLLFLRKHKLVVKCPICLKSNDFSSEEQALE